MSPAKPPPGRRDDGEVALVMAIILFTGVLLLAFVTWWMGS